MNMNVDALRTRLKTHKKAGFTIAELVIVVVVLVVLALVVIAFYDQVAVNANDATLKSDLESSMKQLESEFSKNRDYPATAAEVNSGDGLKVSPNTTITYTRKPYGYCMTATNPDATTTYRVRSLDMQIVADDCTADQIFIAGSSTTTGYADGVGANARFNLIQGIGVNAAGDIYVSDYNNQRIRKVTRDGTVSTFVGNGVNGCTMGVGTAAVVGRPHTIVFDSEGVMYVMGCSAGRLLKITSDGTVSVFAGGGPSGNSCTGTGTNAYFYWSRGLAIDKADTLYVAGTEIFRICKVSPSGVVTRIAGTGVKGMNDGPGATAQFGWPWGITVDNSGTLYLVDQDNIRIRKITPAGDVSTLAGTGVGGTVDGLGSTAQFWGDMESMARDKYDNLYVVGGGALRMIVPGTTMVSTVPSLGSSYGVVKTITFGPDGVLYGASSTAVVKIIL